MNTISNSNSTFPQATSQIIHLKKNIFAEYLLKFHINDCYTIDRLSSVKNKDQLLFQKFANKTQQLNLVLVDSIFPSIIADFALEALINNVTSFNEYIECKKNYLTISSKRDKDYFRYKFTSFIYYLLFSNISSSEVCIGNIRTNIVYNRKKEYFSIFNQHKLHNLLFEKMRVRVNNKKSQIKKQEAIICLEIFIP